MLSCTNCNTPLGAEAVNTHSLVACAGCQGLMRVDAYPALMRPLPSGTPGALVQMDREAACFYHPQKKAVLPCSACGRFLCALCDVALDGQHLCPACLEKAGRNKDIKNLEKHRTCYDTIALTLATISFIFYWVTILTAPIVIYLVLRHWHTPSSIIPRTKIRFVLAFILAGLQIAAWILFFTLMAHTD